MLKLLHTADWQIGRVYSRFEPEDAYALQEARFSAVETLAQLAQKHEVAAVLVAGDVFDSQSLSERTVRRLFNALEGFDGDWIFISGNHDALLAEGVWQFAKRLKLFSQRIHLLEQASPCCFDQHKLAILPAPLTQRHTVHDLTQWFDSALTPDGYFRVGMAHGSVQGVLSEAATRTNPIAAGRAQQARLDYLALGDWHGMKQIDERTWYSGTPEPDRFRNNDAGCALLVCIDEPGAVPQVERIETHQFRWEQQHHVIELDSDIQTLASLLQQFGSQTVLELTLSGRVSLEHQRQCMSLINERQARLRSLRVHSDDLLLVPSADDIAALNVDGYVAQVLSQLQTESADGQPLSSRALVELASILELVQNAKRVSS